MSRHRASGLQACSPFAFLTTRILPIFVPPIKPMVSACSPCALVRLRASLRWCCGWRAALRWRVSVPALPPAPRCGWRSAGRWRVCACPTAAAPFPRAWPGAPLAAALRWMRARGACQRPGGPLLGHVLAWVVCVPPGWRASVACRALCCGGLPLWKASHGRERAGAGTLRGAPLACVWPLLVLLLGGDAMYARSLLRQGPLPAVAFRSLRSLQPLTPARFRVASQRKQQDQNLQRPAAKAARTA